MDAWIFKYKHLGISSIGFVLERRRRPLNFQGLQPINKILHFICRLSFYEIMKAEQKSFFICILIIIFEPKEQKPGEQTIIFSVKFPKS